MINKPQVKPTESDKKQNQLKLVLILGAVLLSIMLVIVIIETEFSRVQPNEQTAEEPVKRDKAPEAVLKAVVTDCDMLTTSLDTTGTTSGYGDYRRIAGYVENRGPVTVNFVRVQVIWRNKDDKIIQLDEIFATGETPLLPGERAKFEDSKRNYLIQKCGAKVLDWWTVAPEDV